MTKKQVLPDANVRTHTDRRPADAVSCRTKDQLELELKDIWESTLGIPNISVNDNYYDLVSYTREGRRVVAHGSLAAIAIFAKIHSRLGKELPPATLLQESG